MCKPQDHKFLLRKDFSYQQGVNAKPYRFSYIDNLHLLYLIHGPRLKDGDLRLWTGSSDFIPVAEINYQGIWRCHYCEYSPFTESNLEAFKKLAKYSNSLEEDVYNYIINHCEHQIF